MCVLLAMCDTVNLFSISWVPLHHTGAVAMILKWRAVIREQWPEGGSPHFKKKKKKIDRSTDPLDISLSDVIGPMKWK